MKTIEDIERLARELALDDVELSQFMHLTRAERRKGRLLKSKAPLNDDERQLLIEDRAVIETPAFKVTRDWLDAALCRGDRGAAALALCGPEGSGRHLAACWALAREGGHYRDAHTLCHHYARATSTRARVDERRELLVWSTATVLVVAEVGADEPTETERLAFSRLVEIRTRRATILVTALSRRALHERASTAWDAKTNEWLRREVLVADLRAEEAGVDP